MKYLSVLGQFHRQGISGAVDRNIKISIEKTLELSLERILSYDCVHEVSPFICIINKGSGCSREEEG